MSLPQPADCGVSTGKFRELQRLTVQYARVLELTLEQDGDDDAMET